MNKNTIYWTGQGIGSYKYVIQEGVMSRDDGGTPGEWAEALNTEVHRVDVYKVQDICLKVSPLHFSMCVVAGGMAWGILHSTKGFSKAQWVSY